MSVIRPKTIILSAQPLRTIQTSFTGFETAYLDSHMVESTSDIGDDVEVLDYTSPRKRRRLTFLSQEEKLTRRKLKNRVAAQTARDRKKQHVTELEEALSQLQEQNALLSAENAALRQSSTELLHENDRLRQRLEVPGTQSGSTRNSSDAKPEPAVLEFPLPQELARATFQLATCVLAVLMLLRPTSSKSVKRLSSRSRLMMESFTSPTKQRSTVWSCATTYRHRQRRDLWSRYKLKVKPD